MQSRITTKKLKKLYNITQITHHGVIVFKILSLK